MQHKRLVIDANILIRAVLGQRVRQLIADACDNVAFYVAEANYDEAEHYLAQLAPARGISDEVWRAALGSIMDAIQLVALDELALVETEAKARIARRDERDWPAVAAAMQFESPRVLRRLQILREWSHEQIKQIFPRSQRARSPYGAGTPQ